MKAVKITVLKRAIHRELAETYGGREIGACEAMRDGQVFIGGISKPEGFCDWAWNDIYRSVIALMTGSTFDREPFEGWMKQPGTFLAACTDGFRPVTFLLERIDTASLIDTSALAGAAPVEVYSSERWGEFSYRIPGLEPGKAFTLRLHFAEVYHQAERKRRFHVEVNGKRVLSEFDIVAVSGAPYRAVTKDFDTAADSSGAVTVSFVKGSADNPKLSALELFPAGTAGNATPVVAINAGGKSAGHFAADAWFQGGNAVTG